MNIEDRKQPGNVKHGYMIKFRINANYFSQFLTNSDIF